MPLTQLGINTEHILIIGQIIMIPLLRGYVQRTQEVLALQTEKQLRAMKEDLLSQTDKQIRGMEEDLDHLVHYIQEMQSVEKIKKALANDRLNRILREYYCDNDYTTNKTEYKLFDNEG